MKKLTIKIIALTTISSVLCACNGFFDKDNTPNPTPLTSFKSELYTYSKWYTNANYGVGTEFLKMIPAVTDNAIYTADRSGAVTATGKSNGFTLWKHSVRASLTAGPAANNNAVFVGCREGRVFALRASDGADLWNTLLSSEILSPPSVSNNIVLVKTIDGQLTALSATDGHPIWHFQQNEPTLILRGGSAPQVSNNTVVAGFENGNLAKLTLNDGSLLWQQTVAIPEGSFAIQRMVDIDANPIIYNNRIYVATYQGQIAALELSTGKTIWTHEISSFTGLAVDGRRVFISDADSNLWAFNADTGNLDWKQTQLLARNITGPALLRNYVIVADQLGYLHWLNKEDGRFVSRNKINSSGVLAAPVVDNGNVYVLTRDGHLASYTIG